ncbi:MAG: T9SS C-terminal target domain-containing protein [Saprospirales bacterium]|nr:MAG: T9SS C-terminal target domain-containing protein [Saprospirales bacterium]
MKPTFTIFLFIFSWCLLPGVGNGQLVINYEDFPKPGDYEIFRFIADIDGIQLPSAGEDQVWDYSHLQPLGNTLNVFTKVEDDEDFPEAKYNSPEVLFFQGFSYNSVLYEGYDENGMFLVGRLSDDTTFSITPISGGPNDVIRFVGGPIVFEGRQDFMKFPLSYGNLWTESRIEYVPFELTVAAFGLNMVPGQRKRILSQTREVIGWGQLTTPNRDGDANDPRDVLLMQVQVMAVDSVFLGGAPAPPQLMDAFGLSQGGIVVSEYYLFWDQYDISNLMRINLNNNGEISSIFFKPDHNDIGTSVRNLSLIPANAYPNPISPNQDLTIQTNEPLSLSDFVLSDINGRIVYHQSLSPFSENNLTVTLPEYLSSGMYFYQLVNSQGEVKSIGKLKVQ